MKYKHNSYNKKKRYKKKEKQMRGLSVEVYNNNVDQALRKLKKMVKEARLIPELREREFYRKPSDIKREQRSLGKLRARKHTRMTR